MKRWEIRSNSKKEKDYNYKKNRSKKEGKIKDQRKFLKHIKNQSEHKTEVKERNKNKIEMFKNPNIHTMHKIQNNQNKSQWICHNLKILINK